MASPTATPTMLASDDLSQSFEEHFPLPLRILCLISTGILLFASNLHILSSLGIDTAAVLDVRSDSLPLGTTATSPVASQAYVHPSKLYKPVYLLAVAYFSWTALAWGLFKCYGDGFSSIDSKYLPAAFALAAVLVVLLPTERFQKKERFMFLRSLKRIFFEGLWSTVPFCDVIMADILTSYAKVLGDVWICVGLLVGQDTREEWGGHWGVPLLTSLPYILRFRQCIAEYLTTSPAVEVPASSTTIAITPQNPRSRSLCNALKYASAFPVIILSTMQNRSDLLESSPQENAEAGLWLGSQTTFRLWIIAVLFNSLYSFWWDVTNDWGLSLLQPRSWWAVPTAFANSHMRRSSVLSPPSHHASVDYNSQTKYTQLHARGRSMTASAIKSPEDHGNTTTASRQPHLPAYQANQAILHACSNPLLRPQVLFTDTAIYYCVVAIDLLLRFTWSLKLSTHLDAIHEIEQGIFFLELLEVVRRWMWVFIRIEWQAVAKGLHHDKTDFEDVPMQEHNKP